MTEPGVFHSYHRHFRFSIGEKDEVGCPGSGPAQADGLLPDCRLFLELGVCLED